MLALWLAPPIVAALWVTRYFSEEHDFLSAAARLMNSAPVMRIKAANAQTHTSFLSGSPVSGAI